MDPVTSALPGPGRGVHTPPVTDADVYHVALCAAGDALALGCIVVLVAVAVRAWGRFK